MTDDWEARRSFTDMGVAAQALAILEKAELECDIREEDGVWVLYMPPTTPQGGDDK